MASMNVCRGCLSAGRQLVVIKEHAKLYNKLLLKKSDHTMTKLMMCWECHQTLKNIHTFRMKITQAQKLLSSTSLPHSSLSTLTASKKIDEYQLIIYEDEKINTIERTDIELQVKRENSDSLNTVLEIKSDDIYDIKDTIKEEIKNESDGFIDDANNDITELDEVLVPIDLAEKTNVKAKIARKRRGQLKQKYRTIIMEDIPDKRNYYDIVKIDQETVLQWVEKKKKRTSKKKFQCQLCYAGFSQQKFYDRHLVLLHAQKNKFECDVCGCRLQDRRLLARHVHEHFVQYACKLCGERYASRNQLYVHLLHGPHGRRMECKRCGARFDCNKPREFYAHYRSAHGPPQCDHCGLRCASKARLAHHIRLLYNEHVKRSSKHRTKPRVPCPACDKSYSKRCYMTNHYNLEHLRDTKFVCLLCDKRFLNGYRLQYHVKYSHEKVPKPKNHMCSYCGRGFNTRRIRDNHVRTHTGERPFACAHCSRAFAQLTALKTHMRSAHK